MCFFRLFTDVPEGSFIVREHTPMSNLFSCLWFNEVDRFTPRDQLSFAYTYLKLRRMNPRKPFRLNMFKVLVKKIICIIDLINFLFLFIVGSFSAFVLRVLKTTSMFRIASGVLSQNFSITEQ